MNFGLAKPGLIKNSIQKFIQAHLELSPGSSMMAGPHGCGSALVWRCFIRWKRDGLGPRRMRKAPHDENSAILG